MSNDQDTKTSPDSEAPAKKARKKGPKFWLLILVPALIVIGGAWFWLSAGGSESTQNANFQMARIPIATQISGRVTKVFVTENEHVKKGAPLFEIDKKPYELALAKAEASLASAKLDIEQLRASYKAALAEEKQAADNAQYQANQLKRQESLTKSGAATQTSLDAQRTQTRAAEDTLAAAQQKVASAKVALNGDPEISVEEHPMVQAAIAAVNDAKYNLSQTELRAPSDGIIYQASSFKPGEMVSAGASLFTLVDTSDVWVIANFKETELTDMQAGQSATVVFDAFPSRTYHATLEAIGAGTGAEFSLLPAQNATGNWVKVTQRVPVRLRLSEGSNLEGLRTGLSADVTVDTNSKPLYQKILNQSSGAEAATAPASQDK
ncbi:membrane protein [Thioclava dalianensis]|uniref:Membrane protein n=1 Tax=Thioclava dalianensis TaxID=1185766 RepID=A0A074T887_9RHOB|nr:HlyD family secretion protein [Thioclava dalianensis]KEP67919.1 membrane protein [Thioclava dalianensis]SFN30282.1 membrane fusion protein, multidrug efflux system [Thioclava dalianensis]